MAMTRLVWLCVLLPACGRGCEPSRPAPQPVQAQQGAPPSAVATLETQLGVRLADRKTGHNLPGLRVLPYRLVRQFDPTRALVSRLEAAGLHTLGTDVAVADLNDEALLAHFQQAAEAWQRRSGVRALRVVLAIDAEVPVDVAARVRRLAVAAAPWRVVGLARDDAQIVELMLNPPGPRLTDLPTPASPTN